MHWYSPLKDRWGLERWAIKDTIAAMDWTGDRTWNDGLSSGQSIAEILVDRYSGATYPEPGPNMMWNTRFGVGRTPTGDTGYDLAGAQKLAENFLTGYLPEAQIQESHAMPGYYTFDFGRNDTKGMLSVNAFSGHI